MKIICGKKKITLTNIKKYLESLVILKAQINIMIILLL